MVEEVIGRARALGEGVPPTRPGEARVRTEALLARMREGGLLGACVPPERGGAGLGLGALARVGFHVGRWDGSAGLIYAMHMSQALSVVRHGRGALFEGFQERMVREGLLIASGTSEKGPGGDILRSVATIEKAGDGRLRVSKESPNVSYVDHADAILISANRQGPKGKPRQVLILAERDATEFTPVRPAAFLGMAGMLNGAWTFTATFPEAAMFPDPFPTIARNTMTPSIHVLWAAVWSGIAAAMLGVARAFVAKEVPTEGEAGTAARLDLTRLADRHHMMNALIRDAIAEAAVPREGGGLALGHAARVNRLKVCASDLLQEVARGAMGVVGIRGYATEGPYSLAQAYADALAAPLMVSNLRLSLNNAKLETFITEEL